jgi:hypothetical protein
MRSLEICLQAGVAAIVWGQPGGGKTSYIEALGAASGQPVETVVASLREPADIAGLPVVINGEVRLAPPAWARRLIKAGKGYLFFDELSCAPPATQAALLRVLRDRWVGEERLPDTVSIVAAANPTDVAAGGWDLAPPTANRLVHLDWPMDVGHWCEGMIAGFATPASDPLPKDWREGVAQYRALVAAFIKAKPTNLLIVPKDGTQAGRAWPSPRTWDMAATLMGACDAGRTTESVRGELLAGTVGGPAAMEFLSWRKHQDLPDPEVLLANPGMFKMPERGDRAFAILGSVVAAVANKNSPSRWQAACEILAVAADAGQPDVAAASGRALCRVQPKGTKVPVSLAKLLPVLTQAGLASAPR